jgi:preprotein translocase subunit SecD
MRKSTSIRNTFIIVILSVLGIILCLPKELPIKINYKNIKLEGKIVRPSLDLKFLGMDFKRDLNLSLGLDLAGGSHLVFEADTSSISDERKKESVEGVRDIIERRVNLFGVSEPTVQTSSYQDKMRVIVELPGIKDTASAIGLIGKTAQLQFAQVGENDNEGLILTDLTGADLKEARVEFDQKTSKPVVAITFTDEGAKKFEDLTGKNVGKPLPIILDNNVISAPVVEDKISGGSAIISGNFTTEEAKSLSIQLNAGALPVPVNLVEQKTVEASLGADSVAKSIKAGVVGLSMVLLFMFVIYGKLGLIADTALIVFGVLTLSIYKLIPITLTLPGIAGFLLSVGMAVDSNILIFERFKEEIRIRPFADALEVSFGRAWDSIRDANIATLATSFILANPLDWKFLHVSGPVRGFAITLALGIVISLFTGIFVSRNLLRVFVKESSKNQVKSN